MSEIVEELDAKKAIEILKKGDYEGSQSPVLTAIAAIHKLKERSAVPLLISRLDKYEYYKVREYAAETLSIIGDCRAVEPLIKMLNSKSEDFYVKKYVIYALRNLHDQRSVHALVPFLYEDNIAEDMYDGKRLLHGFAKESLVELGTTCTDTLVSLLNTKSDRFHSMIVDLLNSIMDERSIPALSKVLTEDNDRRNRAKAAYVIASFPKPSLISTYITALEYFSIDRCSRVSDEWSLERDAVGLLGFALIELGNITIQPLVASLNNTTSHYTKATISSLLGRLGDLRGINGLLDSLSDIESEIVYLSCDALEEIGELAIVPFVVAIYNKISKRENNDADHLEDLMCSLDKSWKNKYRHINTELHTSHGIFKNSVEKIEKCRVLRQEVRNNNLLAVQQLIKDGVNINLPGPYHETALMIAASNGYYEIVWCLIRNGARVDLMDLLEKTAYSLAVENEHEHTTNLIALKLNQNTNLGFINKSKEVMQQRALCFAHERSLVTPSDLSKQDILYMLGYMIGYVKELYSHITLTEGGTYTKKAWNLVSYFFQSVFDEDIYKEYLYLIENKVYYNKTNDDEYKPEMLSLGIGCGEYDAPCWSDGKSKENWENPHFDVDDVQHDRISKGSTNYILDDPNKVTLADKIKLTKQLNLPQEIVERYLEELMAKKTPQPYLNNILKLMANKYKITNWYIKNSSTRDSAIKAIHHNVKVELTKGNFELIQELLDEAADFAWQNILHSIDDEQEEKMCLLFAKNATVIGDLHMEDKKYLLAIEAYEDAIEALPTWYDDYLALLSLKIDKADSSININ